MTVLKVNSYTELATGMLLSIIYIVGINELKFGSMIGRGSFGQVYKGLWKGKTVALKRITIPPGTDVSSLPAIPKEITVLRFAFQYCI